MSRCKMMMAALNAMDAAKGFTTACAMDGDSTVKTFMESAIADLARCADGLGFDLVPRKTPADLHAEALAKGRAEDAIEDNLWSR